jgi:hypothetical protein
MLVADFPPKQSSLVEIGLKQCVHDQIIIYHTVPLLIVRTHILYINFLPYRSRDSIVGVATCYGLENRGVGVRVPVRSQILLHVIQTGSGAYPASYPVGTEGSFRGGKAAGRELDQSPATNAEAKKMWIYASTPYALMA